MDILPAKGPLYPSYLFLYGIRKMIHDILLKLAHFKASLKLFVRGQGHIVRPLYLKGFVKGVVMGKMTLKMT